MHNVGIDLHRIREDPLDLHDFNSRLVSDNLLHGRHQKLPRASGNVDVEWGMLYLVCLWNPTLDEVMTWEAREGVCLLA
jgi:hypothetical protein